jgi:hypothetical protein
LSLKNDIDMVKEEFSSEEKFFEKAVMTERFVKKYKNVMIGSLVAVVVVVAANIAYDINKQSKVRAANEVLAELNKDANNTVALLRLNELSPQLHDVWVFSQAVADKNVAALKELEHSKAIIVSDVAAYELAQNSNDAKKLENYALKQDAIYRDLAQVQSAVILMNSGKMKEAHEKLAKISTASPLNKVSLALLHYGLK